VGTAVGAFVGRARAAGDERDLSRTVGVGGAGIATMIIVAASAGRGADTAGGA